MFVTIIILSIAILIVIEGTTRSLRSYSDPMRTPVDIHGLTFFEDIHDAWNIDHRPHMTPCCECYEGFLSSHCEDHLEAVHEGEPWDCTQPEPRFVPNAPAYIDLASVTMVCTVCGQVNKHESTACEYLPTGEPKFCAICEGDHVTTKCPIPPEALDDGGYIPGVLTEQDYYDGFASGYAAGYY